MDPDRTSASPRITLGQWQRGEKTDLDIFEDQLDGWLFAQARTLALHPHCGLALLTLITPYFEMLESYQRGELSEHRSSTFLGDGLQRVLPEVDRAAIDCYVREVRDGLMHEAMFRRVVIHQGETPPFGMRDGLLWVDPWRLLERTEAHFRDYVGRLRRRTDPREYASWEKFMAIRKAW